MLGRIRRFTSLYRVVTLILFAALVLDAAGVAFAGPAGGGGGGDGSGGGGGGGGSGGGGGGKVSVETALKPFKEFMQDFVGWLLGPGKLVIAAAWLVVGFKMVLGMEKGGIAGFIVVALIGLAIVNATSILNALGIDVTKLVTPKD